MNSRPRPRLALLGVFVTRLLLAFFLVFAIYNPGGTSWYHWVCDAQVDLEWRIIVSGALLLALGVVVPVSLRALGIAGIFACIAVLGAVAAVLVEARIVNLQSWEAHAWLVLCLIAGTLGIGMSWMNFAIAFDGQPRTRDLTKPT